MITQEYQWIRVERDRARVLHFAVYLYLRLTIAQRNQDLGRSRGV